ncbi:MAG TPA: hypothetical protein VFF06_16970 [Polyangia bacterium]|nr:hypothetical protein [Polyangia bacterium]
MRMAIVIAALASSLEARADVTFSGGDVEPVAECGSMRRAQLKHALAEYCEHEPSADARGCHFARRVLRCEGGASHDLFNLSDGEIELSVSDGCGGDWNVRFARDKRGWRVISFDYSFGSCCGG